MSEFPDPRFYDRATPVSVKSLTDIVAVEVAQQGSAEMVIGVASPENAAEANLIFVADKKKLEAVADSEAGTVLTSPALLEKFQSIDKSKSRTVLVSENPKADFADLANHFHTSRHDSGLGKGEWFAPKTGKDCHIDPSAVFGEGVELGDRVVIGPGTVIGAGVKLGDDCRIGANVTLSHTIAGNKCVFLTGARIGEAGFGFTPTKAGLKRMPQLGRVILEDEVEIGANSAVDRGALDDTHIGAFTKIDNLVMIAHNVKLGKNCVLASQTGISGSSIVGDNVMMGGQVGIADHVTIGENTILLARSAPLTDIGPNLRVSGAPAKPAIQFWREQKALMELASRKKTSKQGGDK